MMELIIDEEKFRENAYLCPAGVWTIGYGNTFYKDGSPVKKGDRISEKDAYDLMSWYCENYIFFPRGDFNDDQKKALCSLIYNIGQRAFNRSKCRRAIEAQDWKTAYEEWNWIRANGKILDGLVKRRKRERELFFRGLYEPE